MSSSPPTPVAVALVVQTGAILIGKRPASARYGGEWEFPGGKVRDDESPRDAVVRELREELGIEAVEPAMVYTSQNSYADGGVFDVAYFLVREFSGAPAALAHDELAWVPLHAIHTHPMLAGNGEICRRIAAGLLDPVS